MLSRVVFALDGDPVIEMIEGDKIVVVKGEAGNRVAAKGDAVQVGERVKTGPRATARIKFADGTRLLIGKGSELIVQKNENGTQWNELTHGEVRGIVQPGPKKGAGLSATEPSVDAGTGVAPKKPPPKFAIRSRTAVMGVRGTDFVFGVDESISKAQLHTLEGTVEVAKTDEALLNGEGTLVERSQQVQADQKGITQPKGFDESEYMRGLQVAQPGLITLAVARERGESRVASAPEPETPPLPRFELGQFRLYGLHAFQKRGGSVDSGGLSWNPYIRIFGGRFFALGARGHLALAPLRSRTKSSGFLSRQYGVLVTATLFNFLFAELGGGGESWGDYGTSGSLFMANAGIKLSNDSFIERLFVGVSDYERPSNYGKQGTWQIRAGVGVNF